MRRARGASPAKRIAVAIITLAVTASVVVGIYNIGGGKSESESQADGRATSVALSPGDEVRVSILMRKLKAKPRNTAILVQLGDIFFGVRDFNAASGWMRRALAIDPENVKARLALGAAEFNLGDMAGARRDWLRVLALDSKNVEAYYDLGFLYVSRSRPDLVDAKKMWVKVVELAPGSNVAKTVSAHLKGLETATTAPTAGGKG